MGTKRRQHRQGGSQTARLNRELSRDKGSLIETPRGQGQGGYHDTSRSTSLETSVMARTEPSSRDSVNTTEAATPQNRASEQAMQNGLWDAVEELRQAKSSLEAQLHASERQTQELQGK